MKAIDMFSGCGGLTLGLKAAGFDVVLALDKYERAVESYNHNIPGNHAQVADVAGFDFRPYAGKIDLIAGGPPCQGHSSLIAGKANKARLAEKNEKRNALALDFVRAVEVVRPQFVLMENVRGFAKHPVWPEVYSRMRRAGYAVNANVIDMSQYGLMQMRKRFILLAALGAETPLFPQKQPPPPNCRPAFEGLPPGDRMQHLLQNCGPESRARIAALPPCAIREDDGKYFRYKYSRIDWNRLAFTMTGQCLAPGSGPFAHPEEPRGLNAREALRLQSFPDKYQFPEGQPLKDISQQIGNAFPPVVSKAFGQWLRGEQDEMTHIYYQPSGDMFDNISRVPACGLQNFQDRTKFKDVYGRIDWNGLAPTINGGCLDPGRGRFLHPVKNRGISAREALRLQGFPEWFSLPRFSMRDLAQLIGNAFPPLIARQLAEHLF